MNSISGNRTCLTLILTAFLVFLAVSTLFAQGKGYGVEVRSTGAGLLEAESGKILSVGFTISNKTDQAEEVSESLILPRDWQQINPIISFVLEPQGRKIRIVAFMIPLNTPAGRYEVAYTARSLRDYGIQDTETIQVQVLPVSELEMLVEEKPDTVIAGEEYVVKVRLINRCNYEVKAEIEAKSTEDFPSSSDVRELHLVPGGSQVITVRTRTEKKSTRRITDFLQIRAKATGENGLSASSGVSVPVNIIPRAINQYDEYNRIPALIKFQSTDEGGKSGFQTEFSGSGAIDDSGNHLFDFLFRSSSGENGSIFSQRDEYRMNYHSEAYDMLIGDQTYGLSRLTEANKYGRGIELKLNNKNGPQAGVITVDSRWDSPDNKETGVYVCNEFSDNFGMRLNFLNREISSPLDFNDKFWSIETQARLAAGLKLQAEYAVCDSNRTDGTDDDSYRVSLDGGRKGLYYSLGKIHAGTDYFGYYKDSDYQNGTLTFPITKRLRGTLSGQTWKENMSRNPARFDAPNEHFYRTGLSYNFASDTGISISYDRFRRQDMLDSPKYDYSEHSLQLGFSKSFENSSIQAYIEQGKHRNLLDGETDNSARYSLYYYLRTSSSEYYSLYAQLGDADIEETRLLGGSNTLGISGNFQPARNLSLSVNYSANGFDSDRQRMNHQLYLASVYTLPNDSFWTLRFRNFSPSGGDGESALMLSYTTPWHIPISKKRNIGTIRGRVYDVESTGSSGISRAIVTASGASSATNDKGEFVIAGLPPGNYSIALEQGSIGLNRITRDKTPILVEVKDGKTTELEIPVTRSSALVANVALYSYQQSGQQSVSVAASNQKSPTGTLVLEGYGENGRSMSSHSAVNLAESGKLQGALIELSNGVEVLRGLTDNNGKLSLPGLRPGHWQLKIYDFNLPAYHYVERSSAEVELMPGEEETVTIRVLPRIRPINIIETGTLMSAADGMR